MKFFITVCALFFFSAVQASGNKCKEVKLTSHQKEVINHSYANGSAEDFGYTLAAIAMVESRAGEYLMNWSDPSFGIHHILISTAANSLGIKGHYNEVLLGQQLISDPGLSAKIAISVLRFWKASLIRREDFSWTNLWGAYNAGSNYDSSQAREYSYKIAEKIRWLNSCYFTQDKEDYLKKIGGSYKIKKIKVKPFFEHNALSSIE